ncbi:MAG TPA: class II glutamine amidotransferase, partial [Acetobacteraceae bacterium]|nr:class II glutamine amidotransferase [Acetobacteraceae bacterium]
MCRWIAYAGPPLRMDTLLFRPENSLIRQSLHATRGVTTNGDGFGLGWYGERSFPGLYRDILPAWNDANLRSLAEQVRARLFFAHVRASTGTATSRENCHPFAFEHLLFMHNGRIGGYDRIRRRLEALVDDAFYQHRRGTTDSEVFFLLALSNGLFDEPIPALARTLGQVRRVMAEAGI